MERIQKVIAQSGYCSRRKAEELIAAGKVKVNGRPAQTGMKVSGLDQITINGMRLAKEEKVYYVLNKPKGCLSTVKDEPGKNRKTVVDFMPEGARLFPVGRLDYDTSGVLIMTNDGEFANKMMHPRHHIPKTYEINLQGILSEEDIRKLRKGFEYEGMSFAPAKVFVKSTDPTRDRSLVDLTIYEGQNHQVKKMMEALGHQVRRLHRSRFGFITTGLLRPGEFRKLKSFDVRKLVLMSEDGQS